MPLATRAGSWDASIEQPRGIQTIGFRRCDVHLARRASRGSNPAASGEPVYSRGFRAGARELLPSGGDDSRGGLSSTGRAADCGSAGYGFDPHRPPHPPPRSTLLRHAQCSFRVGLRRGGSAGRENLVRPAGRRTTGRCGSGRLPGPHRGVARGRRRCRRPELGLAGRSIERPDGAPHIRQAPLDLCRGSLGGRAVRGRLV